MENAIQTVNDVRVTTNDSTPKKLIKPNEAIRELHYLYLRSIKGKRLSHKRANDDLTTVASTANLSKIRSDYGIKIENKWIRKKPPQKSYKEFWLEDENLIKAEKLLHSCGLV
ncbi:MAG: hypothetical protein U9R28_11820 [Pseudomonadota bacterium]|nr:hypothetical protein [Pseudomonadota bacterium]